MPGDLIRRPPVEPTAEVRLPLGLRGLEPLFRWLMDTAAASEKYAREYAATSREILEEIKGLRRDLFRKPAPEPIGDLEETTGE